MTKSEENRVYSLAELIDVPGLMELEAERFAEVCMKQQEEDEKLGVISPEVNKEFNDCIREACDRILSPEWEKSRDFKRFVEISIDDDV